MRILLALTFLLAVPALAQDDGAAAVPLRPLTYPKDTKLTAPPVANFRKLFVDPATFAAGLKPDAPPASSAAPGSLPATGTLLVTNDRMSQAQVAINDVKVGVIGPMTIGSVSPVRSGSYRVTITWLNGFSQTTEVGTTTAPAPGAYGGPAPTP